MQAAARATNPNGRTTNVAPRKPEKTVLGLLQARAETWKNEKKHDAVKTKVLQGDVATALGAAAAPVQTKKAPEGFIRKEANNEWPAVKQRPAVGTSECRTGAAATDENNKSASASTRPAATNQFTPQHIETRPSAKAVPSSEPPRRTVADEPDIFRTVVLFDSNKTITEKITVAELEKHCPVNLMENIFAKDFADDLLTRFLEVTWRQSKRWLYDKEIVSHRLQTGFSFDHLPKNWKNTDFGDRVAHVRNVITNRVQQLRSGAVAIGCEKFLVGNEKRPRDEAWKSLGERTAVVVPKTINTSVEKPGKNPNEPTTNGNRREEHQASSSTSTTCLRLLRLQRAAAGANLSTIKHFGQYIPGPGAPMWKPDFCVCNYYTAKSDFLGAHSDPVQSIGPWALVAAFTLGASRQFKMKPVNYVEIETTPVDDKNKDQRKLPKNTSKSNIATPTANKETPSSTQKGRVTSYAIRLPHNSLLVMWEGFQEFWRHEVPVDNKLHEHPISGEGRLSFTFRERNYDVSNRAPNCHCGKRAMLKPVFKANQNLGRYFWSCTNPRTGSGRAGGGKGKGKKEPGTNNFDPSKTKLQTSTTSSATYTSCEFFKWDDEVLAEEKKEKLQAQKARKTGASATSSSGSSAAAFGGSTSTTRITTGTSVKTAGTTAGKPSTTSQFAPPTSWGHFGGGSGASSSSSSRTTMIIPSGRARPGFASCSSGDVPAISQFHQPLRTASSASSSFPQFASTTPLGFGAPVPQTTPGVAFGAGATSFLAPSLAQRSSGGTALLTQHKE
ncbi:unnamed protein product [Amoebophrya sp. A120]|nr:unnamed protein product [Amoebophrya sp. A120]|eukprot:GSA120T00025005001.1